jgi:hypothetical protein
MLFEVELWGITAEQEAETRSKARYRFWLRHCDVLPYSFGEFMKMAKVRRKRNGE